MRKLIAVALATLFLSSVANASVVYQWQGNNDAPPYNIELELVFTDDVVANGSMSINAALGENHPLYPDSGLESFSYFFPNHRQKISYKPMSSQLWFYEILKMNISFLPDGTLTGMIEANNSETNITLQSVGNLFTVTHANSDGDMFAAGCYPLFVDCVGATGQFVREQTPADVPEPGNSALTGLALAGLAFARRKVKLA